MHYKLRYYLLYLFLLLSAILAAYFFSSPAGAQTNGPDLNKQIMGQVDAGAQQAGIPKADAPQMLIARVIKIILSTVGIVFIALIVYGGYDLITARGDEAKVEKALEIIRPAVVGLIIILMAYGITVFVSSRLVQTATEGAVITH